MCPHRPSTWVGSRAGFPNMCLWFCTIAARVLEVSLTTEQRVKGTVASLVKRLWPHLSEVLLSLWTAVSAAEIFNGEPLILLGKYVDSSAPSSPICLYSRIRAGIFKQSVVARNLVGIGLSYRPARLHRLAELVLGIDSWTP
jgi:hypothetical protein